MKHPLFSFTLTKLIKEKAMKTAESQGFSLASIIRQLLILYIKNPNILNKGLKK
jgi:hypothetical protein